MDGAPDKMTEPNLPSYLLIIAVLLFLSAFFSAAETAFISLSNYHFKKLMGKDRRARRLRKGPPAR